MDSSKSSAISTIRVLAMISIILCHFFQSSNNILAWWFNVGVQIFLCISGFLYSNKKIDSYKSFLEKRYIKILSPVYIYISIIMICHFLFIGPLNYKILLTYIFEIQGIYAKYKLYELSHLWYITLILICYLLLYPLSLIKKKLTDGQKSRRYLLILGLMTILGIIVGKGTFIYILLFSIMYLIGKNYFEGFSMKISYSIVIIAVAMCGLRIYVEYFSNASKIIIYYVTIFEQVFLGMGIFIVLYNILNIFYQKHKLNKIIGFLDKYSYEIYIVHATWIMGPMSIYNLNNKTLSIIFTILVIIVTAIILKKITNAVMRLILR